MNRNVESHFSVNPTNIDISRSTFDRSFSHKTSFDVGQLIPFYLDEVLPGDTFNVDHALVARLQTLLTPMMDNLYLDTYFFFVPHRLVWDHWKEFNGENTESAWAPSTEYSIPQLTDADAAGFQSGSLADYFGLPIGKDDISVSALPFRSYALIVNEWFRDQNLQDPVEIYTGDATTSQNDLTGSYITDLQLGGAPFVASKYHDYFTSCLPAPQKGPDVTIPVGQLNDLPVVPIGTDHPNSSLVTVPGTASFIGDGDVERPYLAFNASGSPIYTINSSSASSGKIPVFDNLFALGDGSMTFATINQLRLAFQIQKMYEKDARGGTRYIEILKAHFGVTSPDARLQRPEYLGGNRIPLSINQVIQQSETSATSPMGNVAGYSLTTDRHSDFFKSFTEHGFIIGLCVARYDHTYQQGLARLWSRKSRFDYYWPVFANIGEQAVKNKEIYYTGTNEDQSAETLNEQVFGYQEAWADYRYKPSYVTGEMRSNITNSLDVWHLADDYSQLPSLSAGWIEEEKSNVDRVLSVSSQLSNQIFMDVYVKNKCTRPMPMYSIPGLIDHH